MKANGGGEGIALSFLTSALRGGEWLASRLGRFAYGTRWIEGCVSPRAGRDTVETLPLPSMEHPQSRPKPVTMLNELSRLWEPQSQL
jgi:hypothetical protein